jgi:hypothetical protein
MCEFESSEVSQAVGRSEKMSLTLAERPANGGPLRISRQSPGSNFRHSQNEIADSLRRTLGKFPFSGDGGRRPGSICTVWPSLQCKPRRSPPLSPSNWECRVSTAASNAHTALKSAMNTPPELRRSCQFSEFCAQFASARYIDVITLHDRTGESFRRQCSVDFGRAPFLASA